MKRESNNSGLVSNAVLTLSLSAVVFLACAASTNDEERPGSASSALAGACGCNLTSKECVLPKPESCAPDQESARVPGCGLDEGGNCVVITTNVFNSCATEGECRSLAATVMGKNCRFDDAHKCIGDPVSTGLTCSKKAANPGEDGWDVSEDCSSDPANCYGTCARLHRSAANGCRLDGVGDVQGTCVPGAVCGDGTCNGDETCSTCPGDCGECPCGDGGACGPICGDGTCNGGETCSTCPGDCGGCPCSDGGACVRSL